MDGALVSDGADTALVLDGSVRRHWNRKALVWSATPVVVSDDVAEVVVAMVWAVTAAAEGWVAATETKAVLAAVEVLMRAARPTMLDVAAAAVHTGRRTGDP